ncbi:MAG: TauD/TfdA family dioxygenase [Rhodospirillales bacterium]
MTLSIKPLSDAFGVEVEGIDLSGPIDEGMKTTINKAFVDGAVIVFRDQHLEPKQFLAAAEKFGVPLEQLLTRNQIKDCPQVNFISNQEKTADGKPNLLGQTWHTDHSFWPNPPKATMLHAITLPASGGDTCFADMRLAYETLPESLRARISGLKAVHAYREDRKPPSVEERARAVQEKASEAEDGMVHPVVRTHPDTGRQAIYINPLRIKRFLGLSPDASARLVEELTEHATREAFVYRHKWRPGDVVMWDNRSVMHMVDVNYDITQPRLLHRIILEGQRPV